jgi:uncharacterized membrane protein YeaQ/YmgE (transglycosylase-associated protein family)
VELSLVQIIVFVLIGVIAAYLAGAMFRGGYPMGFLGAFLAALIGEWLMINVLHIILAPEVSYAGIPIITALVGAILLALLWAMIAGGGWGRRWRRY